MDDMSSSVAGRQWEQPSLGPDFDTFHKQMLRQHWAREDVADNRPADDHEVTVYTGPAAAIDVARTREIRNGFHPESRGLRGSTMAYRDNRENAEERLFDIPLEAGHPARPVYAALRHQDLPRNEASDSYGNVGFDIHPGRHMTTTSGDSLDTFTERVDEHFYENDFDHEESMDYAAQGVGVETLSPLHTDNGRYGDYREVQIHGGSIPLSQIKRANIITPKASYYTPPERLAQLKTATKDLRKAGVAVRTMEERVVQPTLSNSQFGEGVRAWVPRESFLKAPRKPRKRTPR